MLRQLILTHPKPKQRLTSPFLGELSRRASRRGTGRRTCTERPPLPVGTAHLPPHAADLAGCARTLRRGAGRRGAAASAAGFPPPPPRVLLTGPAPAGLRARAPWRGGARPRGRAPVTPPPPPHPGRPSPESRVPGSRGSVRGDWDPAPPAPTPPPRRARRRALPLPCPVHGGARSDRSRRCRRSRRQRAGDDLGVAFGAGCRAGGLSQPCLEVRGWGPT